MRLIDNWKTEAHRLWSVRAAVLGAVLWSAIGGLIMIWPALSDHIPIGFYVAGGVVLSVAFGLARVLKQPGASD